MLFIHTVRKIFCSGRNALCRMLLIGMVMAVHLCAVVANAQAPTLFSSNNGLSNSCIHSLYEDSRHNIWIATRNGLNRYDGVKMNVYRHDDADPWSLGHNIVMTLHEYDAHHLLVGIESGIQSYDYATNNFTPVPIVHPDGDTITAHILNFCPMEDGRLFVCMSREDFAEITTDKHGNLYAAIDTKYNPGTTNEPPTQLLQDRKQRMWVTNRMGDLYRFDKTGKGRRYAGVANVLRMLQSASGRLYICTRGEGLMRYEEGRDQFVAVSPQPIDYIPWTITPNNDGRINICTDGNGVKVYDEKTGKIKQIDINLRDFYFSTSNIKDVLTDHYGNVWVGIYWKGVLCSQRNISQFEYVGRYSPTKNSLGTNSVTAIYPASNGKVWVATDHCGLYQMEADGTSSVHWKPEEISGTPSTYTALYEENDKRLWMGSFSDGLWYLDIPSGRISRAPVDVPYVFGLKADGKGDLWVASMGNGFYCYDLTTGKLYHYAYEENTEGAVGDWYSRYNSCVQIVGDRIFVGTASGVEVYRKLGGHKLKRIDRILTDYYVSGMVTGGKDCVWVATNRGLLMLNVKSLKSVAYTEADGLANNSVNSLVLMGKNLWLGTDNCLSCLNTATKRFYNFFHDDGLRDSEFPARSAALVGKNLYFGGISGITYFNPEKLLAVHKAPTQPRLRINDIYVNNVAVYKGDKSGSYDILTDNIDATESVTLTHSDNHFSLELTVPGLADQHFVYEYSYDGEEWVNQGTDVRRLVFSNLKPGTYDIHLRAVSFRATSEERVLTVIIKSPWYATTLARIIYFIVGIAIVFLIINYTRRELTARKVLMRHRQERRINEARIQFFMNISHEIRTPMTLILSPLEKLMRTDNNPERQRNYRLIQQNSQRILRLVNQMMDVRKIEQGKYKLQYKAVDIVKLVDGICSVFSSTAANRNISLQFLHPDAESLLVSVDPDNFDKIMMNLLSNSFKFTPDGGRIAVSMALTEDKMVFTVTDSGVGISDEDKPKIFDRFYSAGHENGYIGTGIGLNLTSLLVKLHGGKIEVTDNPEGRGTCFVVQIPLNRVYSGAVEGNVSEEVVADDLSQVDEVSVVEKAHGLKHRNVLVVEDDPSIRQYLVNELSDEMTITELSNGIEAWNYLQRNTDKVDLVISDRMMPEMDGLTLCQKLKQNPVLNHIPVMLMTALGSDADRIEGIEGGADAYISKPFNIDVLRAMALNLMVSRQMLHGKYTTEQKVDESIEKVEIVSPDEQLMSRVLKVLNENISNPDLSVETLADMVGISRVHFYRKMKELTGQTPRDFLKTIRLKEAARLLSEKKQDITAVCDAIGFKSLSTFSTSFKAMYGMTPSEYQNNSKNKE